MSKLYKDIKDVTMDSYSLILKDIENDYLNNNKGSPEEKTKDLENFFVITELIIKNNLISSFPLLKQNELKEIMREKEAMDKAFMMIVKEYHNKKLRP